MAESKTKNKIKAQNVEISTLPGEVINSYNLAFGADKVPCYVVRTTGKRISGPDGLLGEISGQFATENVSVQSNGKSWVIPRGSLVVCQGNITRWHARFYGDKLSTKKLVSVISAYETAKAYYTFCESGYKITSNISLTEKVFEWLQTYAEENKIRIGYVISAVVAHDKATAKYAKKFMKGLKKEGQKVADLAEDIEAVAAELADLTSISEEAYDPQIE